VRRLARRLCGAGCALACLAGCLSERPRPGPPQLTIFLDKIRVRSPDTLTGTLRAQDPAGIDSVWMTLALAPQFGTDGLMQTVFQAPFRTLVASGHVPDERLTVTVRARDLDGFVGQRDTFVTVVP
jgi:hypothetical protein